MTSPRRGLLITCEGPEGSGKTTLLAALAERLTALGRPPVMAREPGGTPVGERIRDVLLDPGAAELCAETELLLLEASRAQLVRQVILPALAAGRIVLCDRYADASLAYQAGGRGLPREAVERLNAFAVDGAVPDLTLLLLLPPAEGLRRVADRGRGSDRLERERIAFHERVVRAYRELAEREPRRVRVLDATRPPAAVFAEAVAALRDLEHELLAGL